VKVQKQSVGGPRGVRLKKGKRVHERDHMKLGVAEEGQVDQVNLEEVVQVSKGEQWNSELVPGRMR